MGIRKQARFIRRRRWAGASAVAAILLAMGLVWANGAAGANTISSSGPLTSIGITPDLNCSVNYTGDTDGEFFDDTACGTFVALGGNVYGPADVPAGSDATGATGYVPFTPVSQVGPTGTGTTASPFTIRTTVGLGTTGWTLNQTDTYVTGTDTYRTQVDLVNPTGSDTPVIVYRAGDCFLQDSDRGLGEVDGSAITCKANPSSDDPDRIEQFLPLTAGSNYYEAEFAAVWEAIGSGESFPDTCDCSTLERRRGRPCDHDLLEPDRVLPPRSTAAHGHEDRRLADRAGRGFGRLHHHRLEPGRRARAAGLDR